MSEETQVRYAGRMLKVKEVSAILRVHENTVRVWIRKGILEASLVPVPGRRPSYRIAGELVDTLLKNSARGEDSSLT